MIVSSNMMRVYKAFGVRGTFDAFERAGIEGMDFGNNVAEYCSTEHDEGFYRELGEYAKSRGVKIGQAHAPFPSSYADAEKNEKRFNEIVQSIKNASYLGAPMVVVHPCGHLDYTDEASKEISFEYNLDFYRRLIPFAREYGIKIAIENMDFPCVTATPEGLNKLFDALDDPIFTVCFDTGHSLIEKVDPAEAIRVIGHRLVDGCTHFHDNFGDDDDHTLPFYGKIDWESVMKALAEIGYEGDINYEAANFIKNVPTDLYVDALTYMSRVGRYLIGRFEYYSSNK